MSKIKMLLDVVQDMRSLTDSLEALARAIEESEEQQGDAVRMEPIAIAPEQTNEPVQAVAVQEQTAENRKPAREVPCVPVADNPLLPHPSRRRWWNCARSWRSAPRPRPVQDPRAVGWARRGQAHRPAGKRLPRPDAGGGSAVSEMAQATGNIDHAARAHAALSASSSHRWLMCPPSVKLSGQFEDKPSVYAEEGTFLHELSEMKLHRYLGDMTPEVLKHNTRSIATTTSTATRPRTSLTST